MHSVRIFLILSFSVLMLSCKSAFTVIERDNYKSSDIALKYYLQKQNIEVTDSNSVDVLNGAHEKFDSLLKDISEAKHHIHLEYFNFRNDSINAVVIKALAEKAAQGVEVRAMFDGFGNMSNNRPLKKVHLQKIEEQGIEIVMFDPVTFPWINHAYHRDHRKIVVIDGKIGYIGGINVADYYLTGLEGVGKWRDMHSKVQGRAVAKLQDVFLAMWNRETGQNIGGPQYYPQPSTKDKAKVAVVDRWPTKNAEMMRRAYANAINSAKESVCIVNPYFIPTRLVRRAIKKALKDSINVEIMISSKSDIPYTPDGAMYVAYKLMKKGAKIYLYDEGFNHSKVMGIDGKFCTIGSANLNSRSLCFDYECNLFIFDSDDTRELLEHYDNDKKASFLMTKEYYKKRPLWNRFCGWVVNFFTPFM
ncbi:MAG: cardiolipin synthase [Bacteroidales bacterium]|nr:cardiolipin synthase [Bacteroidales bacterium]